MGKVHDFLLLIGAFGYLFIGIVACVLVGLADIPLWLKFVLWALII